MEDEFEEFLKSLKYFFNTVLYSARNVRDWSDVSIKQGLGWALYCEKAIQEPSIECAALSYLKSKPFKEHYTVDDIKSLRKLLISNLMLNQFLSEDVVAFLIEISSKEFGVDETSRLVNASVEKVNNYQMIIKTLRTEPYEEAFNIFKVRLLVEATSSGSAPLSSLNNLLTKEDDLKLLLKLSKTLCTHEKNSFLSCLGKWMKSELELGNLNYKVFHQIASLPSSDIEFVCNRFPGFHTKLLSVISFVGNKISLEDSDYQNDEVYKSLVSLCSSLLNSEDLSKTTKNIFGSLSVSQKYYFWHKLFMEAQIK